MASEPVENDNIDKVLELKQAHEDDDDAVLSPSKLNFSTKPRSSTPRRMSIQQSLNKTLALQQEDLSSSFILGAASGTQSLRINRHIEQSYLQQIQQQQSIDPQKSFNLGDILDNINGGMQVVVDDDFSLCFKRPERRAWNFNAYLFILWSIGVVFRYLILFPFRLLTMTISILLTLLQFWIWKKIFVNDPQKLSQWELWSLQFCAKLILASWGAVIEYKGVIAKRKANQIYVSNHTTMVDWMLLMQMTPFCVVGQLQSSRPLVLWFQTELLKSLNCVWFNRSEQKDRALAMKRIRGHILDSNKPRLLIFPEGTCVNNEYCIQFKKGAFTLNCEICPVGIKYNASFIDAYWISRQRSFGMHLVDIMTSWAMVAEVHYLEPVAIKQDENAIQFSNRCKKLIADAAGLKDVEWNGYLKHYKPSERVINASKKVMAENLDKLLKKIQSTNAVGNGVAKSSGKLSSIST